MRLSWLKRSGGLVLVFFLIVQGVRAADFSILDYRAKADDIGHDTLAIQRALDDAAQQPGSRVIVPSGTYRITQLNLRSHTTLHLEEKAVLESSARWEDWGPRWSGSHCLLFGKDLEKVTISGMGKFDGVDCFCAQGEEKFRGPHLMIFNNCRELTVRDITIERSANWALNCYRCEDVTVEKVKIRGGHDGLHLQQCRRARAIECDFRTGDDAFAGCDNEDVFISGCQINSSCEGMRLSANGLTVKDSRFWGPGEYPHRSTGDRTLNSMLCYFSPSDRKPQIPGQRMIIENCTVEGAEHLVLYKHGTLWQDGQPLKDLTLRKVKARELKNGLYLTAHPENSLELTLDQCEIALRDKADAEASGIQLKNFRHASLTNSRFDVRDVRVVGRFDTCERVMIKGVTISPAANPNPWDRNWWGIEHGKPVTDFQVIPADSP